MKRSKRPKIKHRMLSGDVGSHYDLRQRPEHRDSRATGMSNKLYNFCFPDLTIRGEQRAVGDTYRQGTIRIGLFDKIPRRFKCPVQFNSGAQMLCRYNPV